MGRLSDDLQDLQQDVESLTAANSELSADLQASLASLSEEIAAALADSRTTQATLERLRGELEDIRDAIADSAEANEVHVEAIQRMGTRLADSQVGAGLAQLLGLVALGGFIAKALHDHASSARERSTPEDIGMFVVFSEVLALQEQGREPTEQRVLAAMTNDETGTYDPKEARRYLKALLAKGIIQRTGEGEAQVLRIDTGSERVLRFLNSEKSWIERVLSSS